MKPVRRLYTKVAGVERKRRKKEKRTRIEQAVRKMSEEELNEAILGK